MYIIASRASTIWQIQTRVLNAPRKRIASPAARADCGACARAERQRVSQLAARASLQLVCFWPVTRESAD
eukprot:scaffold49152_cov376-Isochrysis_galbana.AAC.1